MDRLGAHRLVRNFPLRFRHADGSLRHVLIDGTAITKRQHLLRVILFVRDITRRVELESELCQVSEREQQRLGCELHDTLGQHLHAVFYFSSLLEQDLALKSLPGRQRAWSNPHLDSPPRPGSALPARRQFTRDFGNASGYLSWMKSISFSRISHRRSQAFEESVAVASTRICMACSEASVT